MTYRSCRAIGGVAFYAAPAAVPMGMVKEPWRERPRLGAMNASRAPPGVVHATVPVWVRVSPSGALFVRKCRPCAAPSCHDESQVRVPRLCRPAALPIEDGMGPWRDRPWLGATAAP